MATDASRDNNRRLLVLLQTGAVVAVVGLIISTLVMVKILPFYSCEINVLSSLVGFWSSVRCILSSPLYICIVINSIVLLIFASSSFHRHETDTLDSIVVDEPPPLFSPPPPPPPPPPLETQHHQELVKSAPKSLNCTEEPHKIKKMENSQHDEEKGKEDEDTMDATWRAITGGEKQRPDRKHLKKSETWDVVHEAPPPPQPIITNELFDLPAAKELRKSETFNETVSIRRRCGGGRPLIRRDPSVGLDELNNQVEAFIKKFNDDMRLQRQESDQRFLDMIKRGL
ncbi:hypothetical protein MIMGU_mgv11b018278mg [Erythranthe guttata]|uniref:DUF4408 domain-containing protein n=1 Tax=Erythranthe guttata TaxID=4155 RepID=A0A022PU74_ERYGU|nr:hypothetical protein MIMGU_mgv11b018278mg [Erythranthe guttata]